VPDHKNLFIRLAVNGEVRQNGNTSQFIFTPEEQIEYASNILTGGRSVGDPQAQYRHLHRAR
jgi:hypothetical protein